MFFLSHSIKERFERYNQKNNQVYLGDIIINLYKIRKDKNLSNFKISFNKLWIHGLVHLLGHDHKKNEDF